MAEESPCQRPGCGKPGKPRAMTDPARHKTVELRLCDECYDAARANRDPPLWFRELLTHIGLVG
jgi:hypothetical protein